jgi:spermidine synthase
MNGINSVEEKSQAVEHEMLAHIPLFSHPNPQNILLIGAGTLEEALRHKTVRKCSIISTVGNLSVPNENPRVKFIKEDAIKFLESTQEKFDVILVDDPSTVLDFYRVAPRVLHASGVIASRGGALFSAEENVALVKVISEHFSIAHLYTFSQKEGAFWFIYGSKGPCPVTDFNPERVLRLSMPFFYYNEEIHIGSFLLPEFMRRKYSEWLTPFPSGDEDDEDFEEEEDDYE